MDHVKENEDTKGKHMASIVKERDSLKKEVEDLKAKMSKMVEMELQYQAYISAPPHPKHELYGQACANDGMTVQSWMKQWLEQAEANKKHRYAEHSAIKARDESLLRPVIIAGSGPSLKKNAHLLKDRPEQVKLVSCLHNYGYFKDLGVKADYWVNLDAGEITVPEMGQGGSKSPEVYWESTKDEVLVTVPQAYPPLLDKWQGEKLFFTTIIPDGPAMSKYVDVCDGFKLFYNVGGNALGACLYHARAIMGGNPVIFVGADFAFGYNKKFHPFDSPYDAQYSGLIPVTDVYGNRVYTWQSYYNFKAWFEFIAMGGNGNNPGLFINATEGGILGAYPEGNIVQILQMPLKMVMGMCTMHKYLDEVQEKNQLLF